MSREIDSTAEEMGQAKCEAGRGIPNCGNVAERDPHGGKGLEVSRLLRRTRAAGETGRAL
jgi:hypothetical protein